jgi:hypothetical protein
MSIFSKKPLTIPSKADALPGRAELTEGQFLLEVNSYSSAKTITSFQSPARTACLYPCS